MATENVGGVSYEVTLDTSKMIDGQRKVDAAVNKVAQTINNVSNSTNNYDNSVKKTDNSVRNFNKTLNTTNNNITNITNNIQKTDSALSAMAGGFQLTALAGSIFMIGDGLRQAQISAEKLRNTLYFSNDGNIAGIADDMVYLREVTQRLGLDFESSAQNFAKFSAAAKASGTEGAVVRTIFEGISQSATALGLSAQESERAYTALTQMMSKGVVMAEEWKGQLSESIPIASAVMAKALGVTTAELSKLIEEGKVGIPELEKFAVALKVTTADAANEAADGMQAATNRMGNSWLELKKTIAGSGFATLIKSIMDAATQSMDGFTMAIKRAKDEGGGAGKQIFAGWKEAMKYVPQVGAAINLFNGKRLSDTENMNKLLADQAKAVAKVDAARMAFDPNVLRTANSELESITKKVNAFMKATGAGGTLSPSGENVGATGGSVAALNKQAKNRADSIDKFNAAHVSKEQKKLNAIAALNAEAEKLGIKGTAAYYQALAEIEEKYKPAKGKKGKDPAKEKQKEWDRVNKEHLAAIKKMNDEDELRADAAEKIAEKEQKANEEIIKKGQETAKQVAESQKSPELIAAEEWGAKLAVIEAAQALDLENQDAYNLAKINAELEYQDKINNIRTKQTDDALANDMLILSSAASGFDQLAGLAEQYAGKQSGIYKTMFAASKAFALANAGVNLWSAISQVMANPASISPEKKFADYAAVGSAMGGVISSISSMNYGGGRQYGGGVSTDKFYRGGEVGAEMLMGNSGKNYFIPPENGKVVPTNQLGGGGAVQINITNTFSAADVSATASPDGKIIAIAVKQAVAEVAGQFRQNQGDVWSAAKAGSNIQGRTV